MCGIVVVRDALGRRVDAAVVDRMAQTLGHRGPDDAGTYVNGAVALGFRRLAILDLTRASRQPMVSADGSVVLVFNGEVFNYVELREELRGLGRSFRTSGDAEVLVQAYLEWGTDCLSRLNGEWAFVLYDRLSGTLFGARDRFGVKPLYRASCGGLVAWASEIKALLALPDAPQAINWRTAGAYLNSLQMDMSSQTFFEGVEAMPAATAFVVEADGRERRWRYWSLPAPDVPGPKDPAAAFSTLFDDAVRLRLRSDVPVGICLSGGLDSTAVTCAMSRLRRSNGHPPQPLVAFSYHHPHYDERRYVDATVRQTGAELHRIEMDHSALWDLAEPVARAHDEPVHSLTAMAGFELMRRIAGCGIRVILSGQGADETLGGYDSFFKDAWYTDLRRGHPAAAWRGIRSFAAAHHREPLGLALATMERMVRTELRRARWYRAMSQRRRRAEAVREGWFTGDVLPDVHDVPDHEAEDLDSVLRRATTTYPLPLYLRVEDRNSMAHSVETRLPLLDHRLVELAFTVANDWKIRGGWNKCLLREAMRDRIPEIVRTRIDKMGFPSPTAQLLSGPTFDRLFDLISSQRARERGVYAWPRIRRDLEAHRNTNDPAMASRLFRVAQLELWASLHGL